MHPALPEAQRPAVKYVDDSKWHHGSSLVNPFIPKGHTAINNALHPIPPRWKAVPLAADEQGFEIALD